MQFTEPVDDATAERVLTIIRNRLDGYGIVGARAERTGQQVVLRVPGVTVSERAQIVDPAAVEGRLGFRPLCAVLPTGLGDSAYAAALSLACTDAVAGASTLNTTAVPGVAVPQATATSVSGSSATGQADEPPCGTFGENAARTPDEQPIVATTDADKNGSVDGCEILGPVSLSGTAVLDAQAAIPQGEWLVQLTLKDSALAAWNAIVAYVT
jgi:hypothetical protein